MNKFKKKQIIELLYSLIHDYKNCLAKEDYEVIDNIQKNIENITIEEIETKLLPTVGKVWDYDLKNHNFKIISWNKGVIPPNRESIVFATLSEATNLKSFCDSTEGIEYEISFKALIGACPKDGATLIENESKINDYTIAKIGNKVINSYNGATKYITPKQLLSCQDNNYKSKHNELILDSRYIKEIGYVNIEKSFPYKH